MSYQTAYHLHWEPASPTAEEIAQKLTAIAHNLQPQDKDYHSYTLMWTQIINGEQEDSWYDHHEHMIVISHTWPQVLFTLSGQGEDRDDNWKAFYLAGASGIIKATLVYPEFDTNVLTTDQPDIMPSLEEQISRLDAHAASNPLLHKNTLSNAKNAFRTMYGHAPKEYRIKPAGPKHITITASASPGVPDLIIIFGPLHEAIAIANIDNQGNNQSNDESESITKTTHFSNAKPFPNKTVIQHLDKLRQREAP